MKIFVFIFLMPALLIFSLPEAEGGFFSARRCKKYGKKMDRAQNSMNKAKDNMEAVIDEIDKIRDEIEGEQDKLENIQDRLENIADEQEAKNQQNSLEEVGGVLKAKIQDLKTKVEELERKFMIFKEKFSGMIRAMKKFKYKCKKSNITNADIKKAEDQLKNMEKNFGIDIALGNLSDVESGKLESFICVEGDSSCKGGFLKEEIEKFIEQFKQIAKAARASGGGCAPP